MDAVAFPAIFQLLRCAGVALSRRGYQASGPSLAWLQSVGFLKLMARDFDFQLVWQTCCWTEFSYAPPGLV
jgi:hypothetical protein